MNLVDAIIAFENDGLTADETLDLFGDLIRTGNAWILQGSYGRMAAGLIDQGWIDVDGNILRYADDPTDPNEEW